MSKGSKYRPVNRTAFEIGYGRVFGVKCSLCGGRCYSWDVGGVFSSPVKEITCPKCNENRKLKDKSHVCNQHTEVQSTEHS